MSTVIDRYKFKFEIEGAVFAHIVDKIPDIAAFKPGDTDTPPTSNIKVAIGVGSAREGHEIVVRRTDDGAYQEPNVYDGTLTVEVDLPENDENGTAFDWADTEARVRETVRNFYLPEINAYLENHYLHYLNPTGGSMRPSENVMGAVFSFSICMEILESAYEVVDERT